MKKLLVLLVMALVLATPAFASMGVMNAGTPVGQAADIIYNCPSTVQLVNSGDVYANCGNLLGAGTANGGATSMSTSTLIIPVTYDYVRKDINAIADPAYSTGTLAKGVAGQLLTIFITHVGSSGTWTVTPALATGWATIQFNLAKQQALLLYVNDTVGWVILSVGSSASGALPTITIP
jgi:hypothetical protein